MRLAPVFTVLILGNLPAVAQAERVEVLSPSGKLKLELTDSNHLSFAIQMADHPVIEPSLLGLVVEGVNLGQGAELGAVERSAVDERYPTRGVHSEARNHCNRARIACKSGRTAFTIEACAFDDGVAFRTIVPGSDEKRTVDEATTFRLLPGSTVWFHNLRGHYEGVHARHSIDEVKDGEWAAPPLTIQLPGGRGFASITEADLLGFAGMALQADGRGAFVARLGHSHPASYPYTLRYGEAEAKRLAQVAPIEGTITSPWRVVMVGSDLNTLVNCDIVSNLSPPPDPSLFPKGIHTDWIKPGRAVWKFLDGGESSLEGMKEFSRMAGELGFEYNVVEGFWQRWSDDKLRELVEDSKRHHVGIWLWKHSKDLRDPEARRAFFQKCQEAGVVGVKLDFFDHEAKEVIDLYESCLREAAEHHLMVDFHGANKPAGEPRTWPNEMTREGIYGLEHKGMTAWAQHNTTIPFTRFLAGHADYTPVIFGERRKETSWTHQIASAAVVTSPVLIYGANPKSLLESPAVEMIKSIPSVWDETIVLPCSEIGELAAFARRNGERWFLAILNGPTERSLHLPASFLKPGAYEALIVRDKKDNPAALKVETTQIKQSDELAIDLRAGGGFIARFSGR